MGRGAMVLEAPAVVVPEAPEGDLDTDLVAAVRRGDDRAFEQLYTRYQRRISTYVVGMVKDHGRAEDITQEVFISALRRMRATERPIAFKPWVYEIAKNACIDQFRRSRRTEEVSFDAGEGLAGADQGRLVASEPTPDAAVDAKQQLEQLCGAFGGLSDSHYEILVLREFEGLSYREIGERMSLSRPGVESTLFRARKRLGEEYDELVSGQRCVRTQSIIAVAESATLGARDTRRLARHLGHCQPCRHQAAASGLDVATLARKPLRKRAAERIGALLPLPGFLRSRLWPAGEKLASVSEPMAAGWKAAATAATLLVVGVGTGVSPQQGGATQDSVGQPKPALVDKQAPSPGAKPALGRALGTVARPKNTDGAGRQTSKQRAVRNGGGAPGNGAPAGAGGNSPSTPASGVKPSGSSGAGKPGVGGGKVPKLPSAKLPGATQQAADNVGGAVQNTVGGAGNTVGGAVGGAGNTVGGAVNGAGNTVGGAVGGAGGAVGGAVGGATGAVGGATGAAGGAVGGATGAAGGATGAVGGATGAAGGAVGGGATGAAGGATGALPIGP